MYSTFTAGGLQGDSEDKGSLATGTVYIEYSQHGGLHVYEYIPVHYTVEHSKLEVYSVP